MALTKVTSAMIVDAPFNPVDFGASTSASGLTNLLAFEAAINAANTAGGGVVFVPYGTYTIAALNTNPNTGSAVIAIEMKANVQLVFEEGAELVLAPTAADSYAIILVPPSATNVSISGKGVLTGDWLTHTGVTGEGGMGVWLSGSTQTRVADLFIRNCWGDGVFVTESYAPGGKDFCENITLENIICKNNRRQGFTVESVDGLVMTDCQASLTGYKPGGGTGALPMSGIDIEPYAAQHKVRRVVINNFVTSENASAGVRIDLDEGVLTDNVYEITINNHVDEGSLYGFAMTGCLNAPGGYVVNNNSTYINNLYNGVALEKCQADGVRVFLNRISVINPGRDAGGQNGGAFQFTSSSAQTQAFGNVVVVNPSVTYDSGIAITNRMYYAFLFTATSAFGFDSSCKLIDPLAASGDSTTVGGADSKYYQTGAGTKNQYVSDLYSVFDNRSPNNGEWYRVYASSGYAVKTPDGTKTYLIAVDNSGSVTTTLL